MAASKTCSVKRSVPKWRPCCRLQVSYRSEKKGFFSIDIASCHVRLRAKIAWFNLGTNSHQRPSQCSAKNGTCSFLTAFLYAPQIELNLVCTSRPIRENMNRTSFSWILLQATKLLGWVEVLWRKSTVSLLHGLVTIFTRVKKMNSSRKLGSNPPTSGQYTSAATDLEIKGKI